MNIRGINISLQICSVSLSSANKNQQNNWCRRYAPIYQLHYSSCSNLHFYKIIKLINLIILFIAYRGYDKVKSGGIHLTVGRTVEKVLNKCVAICTPLQNRLHLMSYFTFNFLLQSITLWWLVHHHTGKVWSSQRCKANTAQAIDSPFSEQPTSATPRPLQPCISGISVCSMSSWEISPVFFSCNIRLKSCARGSLCMSYWSQYTRNEGDVQESCNKVRPIHRKLIPWQKDTNIIAMFCNGNTYNSHTISYWVVLMITWMWFSR